MVEPLPIRLLLAAFFSKNGCPGCACIAERRIGGCTQGTWWRGTDWLTHIAMGAEPCPGQSQATNFKFWNARLNRSSFFCLAWHDKTKPTAGSKEREMQWKGCILCLHTQKLVFCFAKECFCFSNQCPSCFAKTSWFTNVVVCCLSSCSNCQWWVWLFAWQWSSFGGWVFSGNGDVFCCMVGHHTQHKHDHETIVLVPVGTNTTVEKCMAHGQVREETSTKALQRFMQLLETEGQKHSPSRFEPRGSSLKQARSCFCWMHGHVN